MADNIELEDKSGRKAQAATASDATLQTQLRHLESVRDAVIQLGATPELQPLLNTLVSLIARLVAERRVIVFIIDDDGNALRFGASSVAMPAGVDPNTLESARISVYHAADDPVMRYWLGGVAMGLEPESVAKSHVGHLARLVGLQRFYSVPLNVKDRLIGVVLVDTGGEQALTPDQQTLLKMIAETVAVLVENGRLHTRTVDKLQSNMREMNMLHQIDRELTDTIALDHVFNMTLDWALRFTNAHAASLALYEQEEDALRIHTYYGYELPPEKLDALRPNGGGGITLRVARSGQTEVLPDAAMDQDYVQVAKNIQAQMAVPVMREDRVVAVVTLESRKLNGFTDDHVAFVEKLATRAAVAIDNARLFTETAREREKLSHILRSIADVVIAVGLDERIMLINQSALAALRLYSDRNYAGAEVASALENTALMSVFERAKESREGIIDEVELPNGRTFHVNASYNDGIGWIIVLHDITPFKEMDKLKSELIATVSHDLKQPLSVMMGYLDLLEMKNKFDDQSRNFVSMIERSIRNMRQLIDDLLDLARIESGIELKLGAVDIKSVLAESIEAVKPMAESKSMTLVTNIPDNLPPVRGESHRLRQVFDNLVSNAVKYTPPEGTVTVSVEGRGVTLRVSVQDNGLGISPEDQAHIFDRFYRVRRPETDSIDGTGLGLAIVKTLVEAHHGKVGLDSRLGEGSTFYVTLPTN